MIELFSEVDGNFPNHHPDPSKPENLDDLIAALQATDAELGLAFDGDGDRLGIVTTDGNIIYPDRQMMLFARTCCRACRAAPSSTTSSARSAWPPAIRDAGGEPLMWKTGHSLVKAKMKEIDAPLGGEMSGHIFFKERWFGFDDGTYAGCRLLEILSRSADPSAVLDALPTSFSHARAERGLRRGRAARRSSSSLLADGEVPGAAEISTIDGLRVDWPDGFGLIRASNTTPVLVLRFEGHTEAALQRIEARLLAAAARRSSPTRTSAQPRTDRRAAPCVDLQQRLALRAYTLALRLLLPAILLRYWLRGRSEPGYRVAMRERLGHYGAEHRAPAGSGSMRCRSARRAPPAP